MIDIDKLFRSLSANTYNYEGHIQNEFFKNYKENIYNEENWKEFNKILFDRKYFFNSGFYQYLLNRERTETIDKMLSDK